MKKRKDTGKHDDPLTGDSEEIFNVHSCLCWSLVTVSSNKLTACLCIQSVHSEM